MYLIETSELLNTDTVLWAAIITVGVFIIRLVILKILKLDLNPLLYIAPRGLITILLFLSISIDQYVEIANKSLILQVIILSSIVMMFGLIKHKQPESLEQVK